MKNNRTSQNLDIKKDHRIIDNILVNIKNQISLNYSNFYRGLFDKTS